MISGCHLILKVLWNLNSFEVDSSIYFLLDMIVMLYKPFNKCIIRMLLSILLLKFLFPSEHIAVEQYRYLVEQ